MGVRGTRVAFGGDERRASSWAGELLRRFADRCAHRDAHPTGEDGAEFGWRRTPSGHLVLPIGEGRLVKYRADARQDRWNLYIQWGEEDGDKFLAQGSHAAIERQARHIRRVGPPGGPEFRGQATAWQQYDDDTEHAVVVDGGLRLMPPVEDDDSDGDGDGVLLLAHNDTNGSVSVLGVGEHDELQDAAVELGRRPGAHIRLSLGGRSRYLHALGADGIVGYLELDEDLFVLGHLGGDEFGLACQSGGVQRGLRTYSLDEVLRGDLGPVQDWADPGAADPLARPKRTARRILAVPRRARFGDHPHPQADSGALIDDIELIAALTHLTPQDEFRGACARTLPKLLNGIRGLVQLPVGNKLLWAAGLLQLIREETGQKIHCCSKNLNACLKWIARRTKLLVRRGRKWELRLGEMRRPNSRLLRWMIDRGRLDRSARSATRRRTSAREQHQVFAYAPDDAVQPDSTARTVASDTPASAQRATATEQKPAAPNSATSPPVAASSAPTPPSPVEAGSEQSSSSSPFSTSSHPASPTSGSTPPPAVSDGGEDHKPRTPIEVFTCDVRATGDTSAASVLGCMWAGYEICDLNPSGTHPEVQRDAHGPASELMASMSYEELAARWVDEVAHWQAHLGRQSGLAPTWMHDGRQARPGGWVRRTSHRRYRPP